METLPHTSLLCCHSLPWALQLGGILPGSLWHTPTQPLADTITKRTERRKFPAIALSLSMHDQGGLRSCSWVGTLTLAIMRNCCTFMVSINFPHTLSDQAQPAGLGVDATEQVIIFDPPLSVKHLSPLHSLVGEQVLLSPCHYWCSHCQITLWVIDPISEESPPSERSHYSHGGKSHIVCIPYTCCLYHTCLNFQRVPTVAEQWVSPTLIW